MKQRAASNKKSSPAETDSVKGKTDSTTIVNTVTMCNEAETFIQTLRKETEQKWFSSKTDLYTPAKKDYRDKSSNKTSDSTKVSSSNKVPNSTNAPSSTEVTNPTKLTNSGKKNESVTQFRPVLSSANKKEELLEESMSYEELAKILQEYYKEEQFTLSSELYILMAWLNMQKGTDKVHWIIKQLGYFLINARRTDTWKVLHYIDIGDFANFRKTNTWEEFEDEWKNIIQTMDNKHVHPYLVKVNNKNLLNSLIDSYNYFEKTQAIKITIVEDVVSAKD